jgi:hypothetical protein
LSKKASNDDREDEKDSLDVMERKLRQEKTIIPAAAINAHILLEGTHIYSDHAQGYLAHANKWLCSGVYYNAAVAVAIAALCTLVADGILDAVKTLKTFLDNLKRDKDEISRNPIFLSAKEALKALITRDEDLLLQAELKVLAAPIMMEEDRLLLLRLFAHIRSKISAGFAQKG